MLFASSHHPSTTDCYLRKDKYQKKLIWYWCDIAYEGTQANRDEEELLRDTAISDGARVSDVAFGLGGSLPDLNSEDDNDNDGDDDEDEDEEEDEEADEPKAKLGKRKSKESLPDDVEEATFLFTLNPINPFINPINPKSYKPRTLNPITLISQTSFCALPEP